SGREANRRASWRRSQPGGGMSMADTTATTDATGPGQQNGHDGREPLVRVNGLVKHFPITQGIIFQREVGAVKAVDGVTFDIFEGETLGLVGESGSGKSTTGRTILQLYKPTSGEVRFRGRNLVDLKSGEMRRMRRELQMIFQDPYASLNPRMTVGSI